MSETQSSHLLNISTFGDAADAGNVPTKEEAMSLMTDWVKNEKLQLHMIQVGTLMGAWARERLNLTPEKANAWEVAGILHDADWDQWPDQHCRKIIEELESQHRDPEIIRAIGSHSPAFFGVEPETEMDHMLYAFDELSGFVHAVSLVRPGNYDGMKLSSVKKKLKEKSFAAQVNREDIHDAISRIGIDLDELIAFVIEHQRETV